MHACMATEQSASGCLALSVASLATDLLLAPCMLLAAAWLTLLRCCRCVFQKEDNNNVVGVALNRDLVKVCPRSQQHHALSTSSALAACQSRTKLLLST